MNSNGSKISCKRGFTLIELLIVVLIISILAAVAVPWYKKAVFKSRFTQVQMAFAAYMKGVDVYILENGFPESSIAIGNKLGIEMHGDRSYSAAATSFSFGHFGVGCGPIFCHIGFIDTTIVKDGQWVENPSPWLHGAVAIGKYPNIDKWFLLDATTSTNSDNLKAICQWWISAHGVEQMEDGIKAACAALGVS